MLQRARPGSASRWWQPEAFTPPVCLGVAPVAIALGSNLGDRGRLLRDGIAALTEHLRHVRVSTFHETDPVGVGDQPQFLNAAATGIAALSARELLHALQDIERRLGRERPYPGAPRTLDLDLILYGDLIVNEPDLIVPHPRFRDRAFVLEPLAEIVPDWKDPVTGRTVGALLADLSSR
jgi:2-amino-4-hydroxy-6-hydroxymethyldihydropteridine diphosphokinase